ncbi:hypothetical protein CAP39_02145 [Sphingomonas sp. IBVSS1]|nr:hypothetical protein CAP39_02145 [Sphingomonas sp. IBVSS1]
MNPVAPNPRRLREDFASLSRLLGLLFGFAALSLFAEGLYRPLKHLGAGLYNHDPSAFYNFHDTLVPLLPALLLLGALWQGRGLFQHLAEGDFLSAPTATGVRHTGEWIIAAAIAGLIVGEAVDGARPGWALLAGLVAIGVALRSLAGVIDHAVAVQADLDQIV